MAPKTLVFKGALVTGSGGGIGFAMFKHAISLGKTVIIVGRTEKTLAQAAKELGNNSSYYVLDMGNILAILDFCKKVIKEHPEVDCLINNAAVQRPLDINNFDLESADQDIDINIRGPMHLTIGGFFSATLQEQGCAILNISSLQGYNPVSTITPVYEATKGWIHLWTMKLRTQLGSDERGKDIKVVEVAPPVATNLYREGEDPDGNKKEKNPNTLELPEFMEFVAKSWESDKDKIRAGMSVGVVDKWYEAFGEDYEKAASG
ncbi:short-chain dehydrogenase [Rhexocercosporidium sp. MPI-PUGE-AT-0058]|nr:short-chain dehydrogenase [Rhexocercosporidium sp. MPI-PUGE-AT-0058]